MQIYDSVSNVIGAEGRRAALLIALDASHDDAFDFIDIKKDVGQINNANISLKTDAEFFKQDTQRKRDLLDKIAENNHAMGEPGMLFWDNIEDWHLLSNDPNYTIEGVNACSEYTTTRFGTCVLGSINLSKFVLNPFTDTAAIDKDRLISAIRTVTRAMDDVADEAIASHPLEEQRQVGADYRSIGIGIMGLADMFIQLGVEYGSKESLKVANIVGAALRDTAFRTSIDIAKEKGAYPKFKYESVKDAPYFKALPKDIQEGIKQHGIRNNSLLSIAPAGTISLLANASSGLEPVFANSFIRTTKSLSGEGDRDYKIFTKVIKDLMEAKGIAKEEDLPSYCVTAHDIDPLDRVELQGTLQHYVDLAISSTVNLKEEATVEDIKEVYKAAHEKGLKGVTVFRNNCFRAGILNTENKPKEENKDDLEPNVEPTITTKDDNIVREEDMLNCST